MLRRRLDQTAFGLICVAKHVQRACLILTPSTRVFHSHEVTSLFFFFCWVQRECLCLCPPLLVVEMVVSVRELSIKPMHLAGRALDGHPCLHADACLFSVDVATACNTRGEKRRRMVTEVFSEGTHREGFVSLIFSSPRESEKQHNTNCTQQVQVFTSFHQRETHLLDEFAPHHEDEDFIAIHNDLVGHDKDGGMEENKKKQEEPSGNESTSTEATSTVAVVIASRIR